MGYVQEARENHVKKKVEEGITNVDYITITETLMNFIFFLIFSSLMLKK